MEYGEEKNEEASRSHHLVSSGTKNTGLEVSYDTMARDEAAFDDLLWLSSSQSQRQP